MTKKEILAKLEELKEKIKTASTEELKELEKEVEKLEAELKKIEEAEELENKAEEQRQRLTDRIIRSGVTVRSFGDLENEKKDREAEYRNAFFKHLLGQEMSMAEERSFIATTSNTDAVVPKTTLDRIFVDMKTKHPILSDVKLLRSGTVITILKAKGLKTDVNSVEGAEIPADDLTDNFVEVTLSGKEFKKKVKFSYRLGQMSIDAFEDYLVSELSAKLGDAMAKDIISTITTEALGSNKFTVEKAGVLSLDDILNGLAKVRSTGKVKIYANSTTIYGAIAKVKGAEGQTAFVNSIHEELAGTLIGKQVAEEDAIEDGKILIVDPQAFIYNIVQDVMIKKSVNDDFVNIFSAIAIGSGSLTNEKAAAIITVGQAG